MYIFSRGSYHFLCSALYFNPIALVCQFFFFPLCNGSILLTYFVCVRKTFKTFDKGNLQPKKQENKKNKKIKKQKNKIINKKRNDKMIIQTSVINIKQFKDISEFYKI